MMYKSNLFILAVLLIFFTSCKKENAIINEYASLNIVNVIAGGKTALLNNNLLGAANNGYSYYPIEPGNISIYIWPYGDSLNPYYVSNKVVMEKRKTYTLFLGGVPGAVDPIFVNDEFIYQKDSVAAIRFVNLSPDAPAVNVTLSTSNTINEFSNIGYKEISDFKYFPATSTNTRYVFEVRNATTKTLLSSITMSGTSLANFVPRFRYTTLVFRGKVSGSPTVGITRVNHY